MKYTAKIKQAQKIGGVKIEPKGGELTNEQLAEIKKDPWGRELIRKEMLTIEGVKPGDVKEPEKGSPKQEAAKQVPASGNAATAGNTTATGNTASAGNTTDEKK